ncbi:MAG: hypothetical protein LRZ91_05735 [Desulfotomaculum sp.]|nr:hypothetical protein [Desulfotomaculum sp.]
MAHKKVEKLIDELVEQGKMDGEEIKQFFDEIIKERKNCIKTAGKSIGMQSDMQSRAQKTLALIT